MVLEVVGESKDMILLDHLAVLEVSVMDQDKSSFAQSKKMFVKTKMTHILGSVGMQYMMISTRRQVSFNAGISCI